MVIIGLTGGSGAGKGTACLFFEKLGCAVVDADATYRALCSTCRPMLSELSAEFGEVLSVDGSLDRKKLGAIVFSDPQKLTRLNQITHPYVRAAAREAFGRYAQEGRKACIYDAPTLFEAGADTLCDVRVGVIADRDIRLARICARDGIDKAYAAKRINSQKSDEWYQQHCDYIITNNSDPASLEKQVRTVFKNIMDKE